MKASATSVGRVRAKRTSVAVVRAPPWLRTRRSLPDFPGERGNPYRIELSDFAGGERPERQASA
jgi:hypothetical protein